jgi:transcriptional regulator with XRE-family HTH domain
MLSDERKRRLSALCKRLRGEESLRSFTKNHAKELQGVNHSSWSSWESEKAGLSADSLDRLAHFIGCSHQSLFAYLDGSKTLDELLQPDIKIDDSEEQFTISGNAAITWMESLPLSEQFLIASQTFNSFQRKLDKLVEEKAEKLAEQKAKELINREVKKELAQEIKEERSQILLSLFSGDKYPSKSRIIKVAEKLNLNTQELMEICDRIYLDKPKKQHKRSA